MSTYAIPIFLEDMSDCADQPLARIHHGLLLAAWAKQRRLALGLTQEHVADRMGPHVDAAWVTQLETGQKKTMVGQPWLGLLARALETSELALLQQSGLLTEELPEEGAVREPFAQNDPRRSVLDLLEEARITAERAWTLRGVITSMMEFDEHQR